MKWGQLLNQKPFHCMDQRNAYVFRELLGMDEGNINRTLEEGGITIEYTLSHMGRANG
jgi:hypothetical protein